MQCPRLDHFVRFNTNGTLTCCGHMVNAQCYNSLEDLHNSDWIKNLKSLLNKNEWPLECIRCKQTEELGQGSIRLNSISLDALQTKPDYLVLGGTLDNVCNSACQTCSSKLSTLIGKLSNNNIIVDNSAKFWQLPLERITQLDINGGEPSTSTNYKYILNNLPKNVKTVRVNTNCNIVLDNELEQLIDKGINVIVTVSLDGIDMIHNYIRWPVDWQRFYTNLMTYKKMSVTLNTWTTVSALNIGNFQQILNFVKDHDLDHSWALLQTPSVLDIKYKNSFTDVVVPRVLEAIVGTDRNNQAEIDSYISLQDGIRKINYRNYYACI